MSATNELESLTGEQLKKLNIIPVQKTLLFNAVERGYDFAEKAEGIALVDATTIAIINDNDFGIADTITSGRFKQSEDRPAVALFSF